MESVTLEGILYGLREYKENEEIHFLGHCLSNYMNTNSQNFQDIWALYENNFKTNGFFVEFGATDGITGSNTYLLEKKYNWTGILAEPNVVWHSDLTNNRKAKIIKDCVYTETGKTLEFIDAQDPALSTIKGFGENDEHAIIRQKGKSFNVNTISLFDLLSLAPYEIDYMSVDTEGSEYIILQEYFNNHADKHKIKCITVEHNFDVALRTNIQLLLEKYGYQKKFIRFSRWDDFFIFKG